MLKAAQEQLLWSLKDKVLLDHIDLLSSNLEPRRHYGCLRSASVLNSEDQEMIDNQQLTRNQRAIKFIDVLRTKGPTAFDALCRSLEQDGTQLFLLTQLNKSLEREIDAHRSLLRWNNNFPPPAQHVLADDLPLPPPEFPSVAGENPTVSSSSKSGDLSLQYSVEEEDGGSTSATSATTLQPTSTLTHCTDEEDDDYKRQSKSEC